MTSPVERTAAIRARLNRVTQGPWNWEISPDRQWCWVGTDATDGFWDKPVAKCSNEFDADFIMRAPEDVAYLLAALESAEARITKALALVDSGEWLTYPAYLAFRAALTEGNDHV